MVSVGAGGGPSAGSPTAQQQPARQQQPSAAALAAAAAVAQASAMAHLQRFRQFSLYVTLLAWLISLACVSTCYPGSIEHALLSEAPIVSWRADGAGWRCLLAARTRYAIPIAHLFLPACSCLLAWW